MFDVRKAQEEALYRSVDSAAGTEKARAIVRGTNDQLESDAEWVTNAMHRLEHAFEPDAVKQIRRACQCGYAMEEKQQLVERLFSEAQSLEDFANCETARKAGLFAENGVLFLQFAFCPCPMLATVDRLPSKTWCQCTVGYSKTLFERVFGCEVEVELLKSIKAGDEVCLMTIVPKSQAIWQRA